VEPDGPSAYFGPLVADPSAFASGALPTASGSWVLAPTGDDLDLSVLAAQTNALTGSPQLAPQSVYTVSTELPALLTSLSIRLAAGRAQLLAAGILLGMLAGIALAAAAGNLVSRGAPRKTLVSFYTADVAVIFIFAAAGTMVQEPLLGNSLSSGGVPLAAWVAGLAVALAAGATICVRAARPAESAAVADASGRQSAIPGIIRAGADLALIGLAGVAVWQAGEVGLSAGDTSGGSSLVPIVAAAPAAHRRSRGGVVRTPGDRRGPAVRACREPGPEPADPAGRLGDEDGS
jgi:hypothetical protein